MKNEKSIDFVKQFDKNSEDDQTEMENEEGSNVEKISDNQENPENDVGYDILK